MLFSFFMHFVWKTNNNNKVKKKTVALGFFEWESRLFWRLNFLGLVNLLVKLLHYITFFINFFDFKIIQQKMFIARILQIFLEQQDAKHQDQAF